MRLTGRADSVVYPTVILRWSYGGYGGLLVILPVTSVGIGVVGQQPGSPLRTFLPSESSFITLTWETQRNFFHPCALMFSLPDDSRLILFCRYSLVTCPPCRLFFHFLPTSLSHPRSYCSVPPDIHVKLLSPPSEMP